MLTAERPAAAEPASPARRRFWPVLGLLALYLACSLLLDPRGGLGTDTGGKVATLEAMDRSGGWSLDVGYWAAAEDPDGALHPLWGTVQTDEGWVQVTTLPMLLAARPLYALGGVRAALLLPMLGGLVTALGAAALARRLGGDEGAARLAFWTVGAASPVVVYALDLWEHSWGLALMTWAVVVLTPGDTRPPPGVRAAALAGVLFGAAATLRTEAVVFAAAAGLVAALPVRRRPVRSGARLVALALGAAVPVLANELLERVLIGRAIRSDRASDRLAGTADQLADRLREAVTTTLSVDGDGPTGFLLGVVFVAGVGLLVRAAAHGDRDRARLGAIAAGAVVVARMVVGAGFVPGFLVAAPGAVAGAALTARVPAARRPVATVVVALPVVWATQHLGGAAPQWGGRYVLLAAVVLAVVGVVATRTVAPRAIPVLVVLSGAVTLVGLSWLAVRSHAVGDAFATLAARAEPVVVFTEPFLPREAGAVALDERWLRAGSPAELARAAGVAAAHGADRLLLVSLAEDGAGWAAPPGWVAAGDDAMLRLLPGVDLHLQPLAREGAA